MIRLLAIAFALCASLARIECGFAQTRAEGEVPLTLPTQGGRVLTLAHCLERAEQNYPKVHEALARLNHKQSQLQQARFAPFFDFTLTGGLGLAPRVVGTSIYSPNTDVAISSEMGLAWSLGLDGAIPLWTFGKLSNTWALAEQQVKVGELEVKKEKNELRLAVRKAYYGILLSRDALALIRDVKGRIDSHAERLAERVKAGDADEVDLLRLRMNRADLVGRESEALKQERVASAGLGFLTGLRPPLVLPERPLQKVSHRLGPLARYLAAARIHRPEVNMAKAGILARQAQVRLEQARFLPDIALGLSARFARAPLVTDQKNPFIRDTANTLGYGAALVLRTRLDFLPQSAKVAQVEAELEAMRAAERYALGGVGLEVEQAFREAEDAVRRSDAYTEATGYAKQWLIQVQQGTDIGTYEDEDVIDPAKEYALKRFAQMNATLDYNMAIAKLALATGWDVLATEPE